MLFKELFSDFIAGTPIKRKVWRGYWVYKYGKIEIHSKNGEVIDFLDTKDILFTISGILQDDWEYANDDNCDIPVPNSKPNLIAPKDVINITNNYDSSIEADEFERFLKKRLEAIEEKY
jgi:hypothetical protein